MADAAWEPGSPPQGEVTPLGALKALLERVGWPYLADQGRPVLRLEPRPGYRVMAQERVGSQLLVYAVLDFLVPEPHRMAVADLLNRINYRTAVGHFEIDLFDGEVRYRASLDFGNGAPSENLVRPLLGYPPAAVERSLPFILEVSHGRLTPEQAAGQIPQAG